MIVVAGELVKECYRDFYVLADNQIKNVAKPYYRFRLKFSQAREESVLIEIIDIAEDITNLESSYFKSKLERAVENQKHVGFVMERKPKSVVSEAYRTLRTNI